ncbi:hypothetical protein NF867_17655 [Solitalea sp. MAHUQ-68]|uniref:Uncharacterized protein n=1 Tax=Solitalea agri TaxID=2953739 RepID=A0A9X2F4P1_9SPHI|nr:hypothetical protein [Solitalea agri]MCO4294692.1 hypothetical protein [Solitalea agri]
MRTTGLTLLTIGIAILAFSAFSMIFKEKDFKIGRVEFDDPNYKEISWVPVLGGLLFVTGSVVSIVYRKQEKI